jgi:AAA domain
LRFQGTGKSFIGALLAKFLHDHSEQTILVVTATNHALDQFLEDLTNIGIPLNSLVRLGGKANAQMEAISLYNQVRPAKPSLGKADRKIIDDYQTDAELHATDLKAAFDRYKAFSVRDVDIMAHIEFEDDEFFQAFRIPARDEGMTQVGERGRAVDEYYLLNRWLVRSDAGVFKQHPHVLGSSKIWSMSFTARQTQRKIWEAAILKNSVRNVCSSAKRYDECQIELQRKFEQKNVEILRSKRIIGCTTTGAAKYKDSIQAVAPDVLLVEEAGEILESHVITALGADAKQMILIGDHKYASVRLLFPSG